MGVQLPSEPITRKEQYLAKAAGQAVEIPAEPITREEAYLDAIAKGSGGGGGGTKDYSQLENKPQIAGVTLQGNKSLSDLGIASATALGSVSDAVTAITNGTDIDSFGDVETALAGKQGTLTAGDYISLNNGNIAVNRNIVGDNYDYEIKSTGDYKLTIIKSQGGTVISTNTYDYSYGTSTNIDNNFTIAGAYSGGNTWVYTALKDSTTHSVGYTWTKSVDASFEETESFPSEDLSGYKLVIKSEMDSALSSKQDTLTFDDVPTDNSNNPVKSNGIYDALVLKQNATDNSLETEAKTIVGAINEHEGDVSSLMSGFTTLDNEVNGDATVYPYADVITIEDAVPANLADCTVKIEPVQDLHGYDHPWVGGAGDNKVPNTKYNGVIGSNGSYSSADNRVCNDNTGYTSTMKLSAGTYTINVEGLNQCTVLIKDSNNQIVDNYADNWKTMPFTFVVTDGGLLYYSARKSNNDNISPDDYNTMLVIGETSKSYTPYTNICLITGHTEASVQRANGSIISLEQGTIDVTNGNNLNSTTRVRTGFLSVEPNGVYSLYSENDNLVYRNGIAYDANNGFIMSGIAAQSGVVTIPDNNSIAYIRFVFSNTTETDVHPTDYWCEFANGIGKTYTIALGSTIYGGTVDFDSGVMTVDRAVVDLGTLTWTIGNQGQSTQHFYSNALSNYKYIDDTTVNFICENYESIPVSQRYKNGTVFINSAKNISIKDDNFNDATAFTTAMDGVQLVYELATPTTIQLTPTQIQLLKGHNTITASTGQISVTVNGVSGSIGAVQEQVNGLTRAIGWDDARNIFNGLIRQGYVSATGEYVGNALRWVCTTKQECKENTTYTVSASSSFLTRKIAVMYFDSNDTIISYSEFDHEASPVNINATITTPDNTAYIIVDIANQKNADGYNITPSDVWDVQIEEGTQVTPYIPYHPVIGTAVNKLLTKVPDAPTTDGTYSLQVTVTSGVPTYSWVSNA